MEIALNLILVIFLVLLNGFFVAAEFAIVKVRSTRLAQLDTKRSKMAQKVVANMDAYLSATQLGITLASLGLGWVGEPAIAKLILEPIFHEFHLPKDLIHPLAFVIAFSIITFLHIVLGEMAPKSLAIRKSEQTTLWTAKPLHWFYVAFRPFIYVLNSSANWILKRFGVEELPDHSVHDEQEIRMLIAQSHKSGVIDQTELVLFDNVFEFTDRVAREVMVPRVNMVCIDLNKSLDENLELIKESQYTRYPVFEVDKDQIIGFIHIRDLYEQLVQDRSALNIRQIIRPLVAVPETMELKDIIKKLQSSRAEIALVVDEYGGTSGLVTTEDIIEEIFGEIQDEFDEEEPFFKKTKEGSTSIDGQLLIDDVNEYFQIQILDEDNDTIGGWIFSLLEKVPHPGDQVEFGGYVFTVKEVDQWRVERIDVKKQAVEQKIEEEK